jgi:hypothetical protein
MLNKIKNNKYRLNIILVVKDDVKLLLHIKNLFLWRDCCYYRPYK